MVKEIKNILLVGSTGVGKSSLANVLVNRNGNFEEVFKESSGSISETKNNQVEVFEEGETIYRVIDTVSFDDNRLSQEEIGYKLAEIAMELKKDGINQIFLLSDGRITEKEIGIFGMLSGSLFDREIFDFTTVIRTKFTDFKDPEACKEDYQDLTKEKGKGVGSTVASLAEKVIYVDNRPLKEGGPELIPLYKKVKENVRSILLERLKDCRTTYQPERLQKFNQKIDDLGEIRRRNKKEVSSVAQEILSSSYEFVKNSTLTGIQAGKEAVPFMGIGPTAGGLLGFGASFASSYVYTGVRLMEELVKGVSNIGSNKSRQLESNQPQTDQSHNTSAAQIQALQQQISERDTTIRNNQNEITRLTQERDNERASNTTLRGQVSALQTDKENLQGQISGLQQQINTLQQTIGGGPNQGTQQGTNEQGAAAVIQQPNIPPGGNGNG